MHNLLESYWWILVVLAILAIMLVRRSWPGGGAAGR